MKFLLYLCGVENVEKKMKVKFLEVLLFVIWFIVMVFTLNGCLSMITAANTIENIVGIFLMVIILFVSYKTRCFLNIRNLWRKEE